MTVATASPTETRAVLAELGIEAENPGAFDGSWIATQVLFGNLPCLEPFPCGRAGTGHRSRAPQ